MLITYIIGGVILAAVAVIVIAKIIKENIKHPIKP